MEHAALDPFRGCANAIRDELPEAVAVLDAFHVVRLGVKALDECRQRVQRDTLGHRGRRDDPLYRIRALLRHGVEHLSNRQQTTLQICLAAGDPDCAVEVAWHCYQQLRSAYHHNRAADGRTIAERVLESFHSRPIPEIARLGRTLKAWRAQFLAYFDTGGVSNVGTEAICRSGFGWSGTGWSGWMSVVSTPGVTFEAIGPLLRCPSVELSARVAAAGTVRLTSVTSSGDCPIPAGRGEADAAPGVVPEHGTGAT